MSETPQEDGLSEKIGETLSDMEANERSAGSEKAGGAEAAWRIEKPGATAATAEAAAWSIERPAEAAEATATAEAAAWSIERAGTERSTEEK